MSLKIELDVDHQYFYVETHPGHHVKVPCSEGGAEQMRRMLLAQKAALVADALVAPDPIAMGQLDYWRRHGVGSASAPTQQEIEHNLSHDPRFPKDTCPFCRWAARAKALAKPVPLTEEDLLEELTQ